jgi:uncharacterized protein YutE (UPF0331/DUF86 family)
LSFDKNKGIRYKEKDKGARGKETGSKQEKMDELDGYLAELRAVPPENLEQYGMIEKKRSCERLLQLGIECVIDICRRLVSGMRLGSRPATNGC